MAFPSGLTPDQRNRFVGGRRHYNATRQWAAIDRRYRILFTWINNPHLTKADLARQFGVSRATLTRDIQAMKRADRRNQFPACPLCDGKGRLNTGLGLAGMVELAADFTKMDARLNRLIGGY